MANREASSSTNLMEYENPKNGQSSGQDSVQMQEFVQNLKHVLHNPNSDIRQDFGNVMHELMNVHTSMLGPVNQKITTIVINQIVEEGNTNPVLLLVEN